MQFTTDSTLSSSVSSCDVSDSSSSPKISSSDQYKAACNGLVAPFEPTGTSIAMAKVITMSGDQKAASMHEDELIEQLLAHWCSVSRTEC